MKMFKNKKKNDESVEEISQEDVLDIVDESTKRNEEDSDLNAIADTSLEADESLEPKVEDDEDIDIKEDLDVKDSKKEDAVATDQSDSLEILSDEELADLESSSTQESDEDISTELDNTVDTDNLEDFENMDEEEVTIVKPVDRKVIDEDTIDTAVQGLVEEKGPKAPSNMSTSDLIKENIYLQTQILTWSEAYNEAQAQITNWQDYAGQLNELLRQREMDNQRDLMSLKKRHAEVLASVRQSVEDEYHERKVVLDNIINTLQKITMPGEEV